MVSTKNWFIISALIIVWVISGCTADMPLGPQAPQSARPAIRILDLSNVSPEILHQEDTTSTPGMPTLTATSSPTLTLLPTLADVDNTPDAPSNTTNPGEEPTAITCLNKAEFIQHLNASPNTAFKPKEPFAKVWLIKNSGTCTWSTSYQLTFIGGAEMGGDLAISLPHAVAPGETVELRVNLISPEEPDPYNSQWMLEDEDGNLFGIGEDANQPLEVIIVVHHIIKPITN